MSEIINNTKEPMSRKFAKWLARQGFTNFRVYEHTKQDDQRFSTVWWLSKKRGGIVYHNLDAEAARASFDNAWSWTYLANDLGCPLSDALDRFQPSKTEFGKLARPTDMWYIDLDPNRHIGSLRPERLPTTPTRFMKFVSAYGFNCVKVKSTCYIVYKQNG